MKPKTILSSITSLVLLILVILLFVSKNIGEKPDKGHEPTITTSGAMQALQFFAASRAYPDSVLPEKGYYQAFQYSKMTLTKTSSRNNTVAPWRSLGPTNIGGRTKAIAINPLNPNTVYAGSASGGLWRSYSGGFGSEAWQYLDTGFPVLGVGAIAIDPSDTNTIYIGTGEVYSHKNSIGGFVIRTTRGSYGIGILKSTNGGATWTMSLDWRHHQRRGVQQICINPLNPKNLYAATTEGTFKSTDAGVSWTLVHEVTMAMDLDLNPVNPEIVFVCCGDLGSTGTGIYRSKDGGLSWELLANGILSGYSGKASLDIYHDNPEIVYAHLALLEGSIGVFRSMNGGDTWEKMSSEDIAQHQGWYSHYIAIHPHNPQIVIAGGIHIWKTIDGGRTFIQVSSMLNAYSEVEPGGPEGGPDYAHGDHHAAVFHPTNPEIIYFATDGGVFRTEDCAETFQSLNGGYTTVQFYNGFSCAARDSNLAMGGLQDNGTIIYEGSPAWRKSAGGDGCWSAINYDNHDILYASSQLLVIIKSLNRGKNWINVTNGITNRHRAGFIAPFILAPSNSNVLYAGTDRVFKTTNAAEEWYSTTGDTALDGDPILSMAIAATNPDTLFVATAPIRFRANVFRTIDGGITWDYLTGKYDSTALPDRYPMDLAVDPLNSHNVYIVFSGFGTSHLYKSNDAGLSWIDIGTDLPDVPSSAVAIDPLFPNHIYFGNDLGVYVSLDAGATWEEWTAGMPTALVMDLVISPPNRTIRAATHGNGVWDRKLIETGAVPVEKAARPIVTYQLHQNYPNPFFLNPGKRDAVGTIIQYELSATSRVSVKVYNTMGQLVTRLFDGFQSQGQHKLRFNGTGLAPGVYFYSLQAGDIVLTKKMLLLE